VQLLNSGAAIGVRVREAVDARTRAVLDAWMALAVMAYSLSFAYSGSGIHGQGLIPGIAEPTRGGSGTFLVLTAFFAAFILTDGLTLSLAGYPKRERGWRRMGSASATMLPLLTLMVLAAFAPATPRFAAVAIVIASSAPVVALALWSAFRARGAGVRRPAPALCGQLSPAGRAATASLGLVLGAFGALAGSDLELVSSVAFTALLLAAAATRGTRVDVNRVARDWGPSQWRAFGCSYLLALGLSVLLARGTGDPAVVGLLGGMLVAFPVVVGAFRPAPIWAD
jgi:hypothetical protein